MSLKEEIEKSLVAHTAWRDRLNQAILDKHIDMDLNHIASEHFCEFGKWLDGNSITAIEKSFPDFNKVKILHAEFHKMAGEVARHALAGESEKANALLAPEGDYYKSTSQLKTALNVWKSKLE